MVLKRLDHIICRVPDIEVAHARLTAAFPEAWPIGRFWPMGRTSGVAVGGLNLELVESDNVRVGGAVAECLVFEPNDIAEAERQWANAGIKAYVEDHMQADSDLLKLRGFQGAGADVPQLICRNLDPVDPGPLHPYPFEFFACSYSPFLHDWLSPEHPRFLMHSRVEKVVYGTPDPPAAKEFLSRIGYGGAIVIQFVAHSQARVMEIATSHGPIHV